MIVVITGVSGSGKTTIGRMLADELEWEFHDADDLHPPDNVEKMRRGVPLTEADRLPWLHSIAALTRQVDMQGRSAIIACSALRAAYRNLLAESAQTVRFVFLYAPIGVLAERLDSRAGHFMAPALLRSQLETLEPPVEAVHVDASAKPDEVVRRVREALDL